MANGDAGLIIAIVTGAFTLAVTAVAWIRFRRKDHADATSVEEGTISARFKDADALMRYIDERVDERTAALEAELRAVRDALSTVKRESHEIHDAVRAHFYQLWVWDQRGRPGPLPMLPPTILTRLGITDPLEDTEPLHPKGSS